MRIEDVYPLPVPVEARARPEEWLPDLEDETGRASRIWEAMCHLKLGAGRWSGQEFGRHAQEWQRRLVFAVYGPAPEDEGRSCWVSEVFLTCAKKNAKTQTVALMMLAQMLVEPTADARYLLLAGSKQQANLLYSPIKSACEMDSGLLREVNVRDYKHDIIQYATGASLRTLALDLESTVGEIPHAFAVDEVHIVTRNRKAAGMIRQMSSGLVASGGVGFYTTTAPLPGEPTAGLYQTLRTRSRSILSGEHEAAPETLLPVCFEPLKGQDLDDPELWFRSNPSIDVTVPKRWLIQQRDIAKANPDPSELDGFKSQHVNAIMETSSAGIDGWAVARHWSQWVDPGITLDRLLAESTEVFVGADAGGQDDLSALVVIGRTAAGGYLVWSRAWLTRHGYATWPKNQPLYDEAKQTGELIITDTAGEDIEEIFDLLGEISPLIVGVDPYGLQDLARRCEEERIEVVGVPQGYRISPHLEGAERGFFADQIRVCSGPLLRWCVSNMRLKDRGGAKAVVKPSGESSGAEKIDLGIALLLAWAMTTQDSTASIYHDESRAMIM